MFKTIPVAFEVSDIALRPVQPIEMVIGDGHIFRITSHIDYLQK